MESGKERKGKGRREGKGKAVRIADKSRPYKTIDTRECICVYEGE